MFSRGNRLIFNTMQSNKTQLTLLVLLLYCLATLNYSKAFSSEKSCDTKRNSDQNEYCDNFDKQDYGPYKDEDKACLRAAVVDYSRIDKFANCQAAANSNLNVFEKIIKIAKENGAQMIVFPEDGIMMDTERSMKPCLEEVPDPTWATDYNPCSEPDKFNKSLPILTRLSCLARDNKIYVIANYGSKEERNCDIVDCESPDQEKGVFGRYLMLNTDVVLDPAGNLIGRYRKWHPFTETEVFHKAPRLEHVYFDTEFGRFGVFTCFDMIFKDPAIDLVETFKIDTAIFPTWWFDELPILPAVQYQDGWSYANQVNLLAANILKPSRGSIGSGIFSGNLSHYVAADLDIKRHPRKTKILISTIQSRKQHMCGKNADSKIIEIDDNANFDAYKYKHFKLLEKDSVQVLSKIEDTRTVCAGTVCCTVSYKLNKDLSDQANRLVVIVRDRLRLGGWYEQVCTVATLKQAFDTSNGDDAKMSTEQMMFAPDAAVSFESLTVRANFTTKYIYPSCAHNLTLLVKRDQRHMTCDTKRNGDDEDNSRKISDCQLSYIADSFDADSNRLYSFGMYGRLYERDLI